MKKSSVLISFFVILLCLFIGACIHNLITTSDYYIANTRLKELKRKNENKKYFVYSTSNNNIYIYINEYKTNADLLLYLNEYLDTVANLPLQTIKRQSYVHCKDTVTGITKTVNTTYSEEIASIDFIQDVSGMDISKYEFDNEKYERESLIVSFSIQKNQKGKLIATIFFYLCDKGRFVCKPMRLFLNEFNKKDCNSVWK